MKTLVIAVLSAATVLAALAAASPQAQTATPDIDIKRPAVFCHGEYALCIRALCSPHESSSDTVKCACVVEHGWSMGPGNCESRKPVVAHGFKTIISTYSNRFNNVEKTLTCTNADTKWAWCYGAPCTVDANDPKAATCVCPVVTGPMRTLGGSCTQSNCNQIWSAATPKADAFANHHFYLYMKAYHPKYPTSQPALACFNKRI